MIEDDDSADDSSQVDRGNADTMLLDTQPRNLPTMPLDTRTDCANDHASSPALLSANTDDDLYMNESSIATAIDSAIDSAIDVSLDSADDDYDDYRIAFD